MYKLFAEKIYFKSLEKAEIIDFAVSWTRQYEISAPSGLLSSQALACSGVNQIARALPRANYI